MNCKIVVLSIWMHLNENIIKCQEVEMAQSKGGTIYIYIYIYTHYNDQEHTIRCSL